MNIVEHMTAMFTAFRELEGLMWIEARIALCEIDFDLTGNLTRHRNEYQELLSIAKERKKSQ